MVQENKRIRTKIPGILNPLMTAHVARVDRALEPGLNSINWLSVNADTYLADVHSALGDLELLVDRVTDIIDYRIEAVLAEMSDTPLLDLSADEPGTVDQFIERTQVSPPTFYGEFVLCGFPVAKIAPKPVPFLGCVKATETTDLWSFFCLRVCLQQLFVFQAARNAQDEDYCDRCQSVSHTASSGRLCRNG